MISTIIKRIYDEEIKTGRKPERLIFSKKEYLELTEEFYDNSGYVFPVLGIDTRFMGIPFEVKA